jgi:superfamily II helicase
MKRALLEVIGTFIAQTVHDIARFYQCTLFNILESKVKIFQATKAALSDLEEYGFIQWRDDKFEPTLLGTATLSSGFDIEDAIILFEELKKSKKNFNLETDLHAINLCTPLNHV